MSESVVYEPRPALHVRAIERFTFTGLDVDFLLHTKRSPSGAVTRHVALPVTLHELTDAEHATTEVQPTFSLTRDAAQELCDELYKLGFVPRHSGGPGELAALRAHLLDLRCMVAKAQKVALPGTPGGQS